MHITNQTLADRAYLRPKDLSGETLFAYPSLSTSPAFLRMLRTNGIRPKEMSEIPLTEAILNLVKAGFGIAILSQWAIQPYLGNGEYRAFPITARGLRRKWFATVQSSKSVSGYLTAFLQVLRNESMAAIHRS